MMLISTNKNRKNTGHFCIIYHSKYVNYSHSGHGLKFTMYIAWQYLHPPPTEIIRCQKLENKNYLNIDTFDKHQT